MSKGGTAPPNTLPPPSNTICSPTKFFTPHPKKIWGGAKSIWGGNLKNFALWAIWGGDKKFLSFAQNYFAPPPSQIPGDAPVMWVQDQIKNKQFCRRNEDLISEFSSLSLAILSSLLSTLYK